MNGYIVKLMIWFLSGCAGFSLCVVFLFRLGLVSETRDAQGVIKKKQSAKGIMAFISFAVVIIAFLFLYDLSMFGSAKAGFFAVLAANFALIMLLVLYDSLVIDLLVIGIIRPKLLRLPDEMDMDSMKEHVKKTFIVGWVYIIPIALISSLLYHFTIN